MQNDYTKSLRLPSSWNEFMCQFSKKYGVSASYAYRAAVRDFIRTKEQQHG